MIEIKLPDLGENIEEGIIVGLSAQPGDTLTPDKAILEVEAGKSTIEVPAETEGVLKEWLIKEGDTVEVGQVICTVESGDAAAAPSAPAPSAKPEKQEQAPAPKPAPAAAKDKQEPKEAPPAANDEPKPSHAPVAASPSVRTLAREIGVSIEDVQGSGAHERITAADVKDHAKTLLKQPAGRPASSSVALPDFSKWGAVETEPLSAIRKATANHMARCWAEIPHVTQHDTADCTRLEDARKRLAKHVEAGGGKLTMTAILLKLLASALRAYPKFNASLDLVGGTTIYKKYIHIGVAVDTPKGLLVPVLRDVDTKGLRTLAAELADLGVRAREGKITPEEMEGGTFTLTNLGGIGGTFFTPIVNAPEVAILGVGRAYADGTCGCEGDPSLLLPLSLSYDHRLIDGADGARFLQHLKVAIEEPLAALLDDEG